MASISVACPKCSLVPQNSAWSRDLRRGVIPPGSVLNLGASSIAGPSRFPLLQGSNSWHFPILKAQFHEVGVERPSNSSPLTSSTSESLSAKSLSDPLLKGSAETAAVPDSMISAFMVEVSNLVKLVDLKDVAEVELKRQEFELVIRKKEALPQPTLTAPPVMMPYPQAELVSQSSVAHTPPPPASLAAPVATSPTPALPAPANVGSKSSLPALKCPMAGTFYRSSAPGEPPFVKVGDKVQKGQVVCIIEAMKLMNEIEVDQSGTVVEILVENGKPVSVDMPLLIIRP